VKVTQVHSNHARAEELERLPDEPDAESDEETDVDAESDAESDERTPQLGSRDNFWGG
jgi:hypothetical protein